MKMTNLFRRVIAGALSVALLSTMAFASNATASTIKLEATQGTVSVTSSSGKDVTYRDGSRLYSGYKVTTCTGYAWLNLDSEQVIKLDYNTVVTLQKVGYKTEIMLESGKLYFDVAKPLETYETLNIRTSTMYTGVRGTIGTVTSTYLMEEGTQKNVSTATLLEGKLDVYTKGDSTEQEEVHTVLEAGNKVTVESVQQSDATTVVSTQVEAMPADEALTETPFAAVEVEDSDSAIERIEESQGVTLTGILESAQTLLTEAETVAEETATQQETAVEEAVTEVESATSTSTASSGSSSGGGSSTTYYTVTFVNGEETTTQSVKANGTATQPTEPVDGGAWCLDEEAYDFTTAVTGSITLTWVEDVAPVMVTVTFQYNGEDFYSVEVESGTVVAMPMLLPTASGAWYNGDTKVTEPFVVDDSITLTWKSA